MSNVNVTPGEVLLQKLSNGAETELEAKAIEAFGEIQSDLTGFVWGHFFSIAMDYTNNKYVDFLIECMKTPGNELTEDDFKKIEEQLGLNDPETVGIFSADALYGEKLKGKIQDRIMQDLGKEGSSVNISKFNAATERADAIKTRPHFMLEFANPEEFFNNFLTYAAATHKRLDENNKYEEQVEKEKEEKKEIENIKLK